MDDKTVKRVEPKPEVNIFLRKPFIADERKQEESNKNNNFQGMLDDSIKELKEKDKSFTETVDRVTSEKQLTPREVQLMELHKMRREITMYEETLEPTETPIRKKQ